MPKVKKNFKYKKSYSEQVLQRALAEVKSGAPKKTVAVKYGIPRQTLQFRLGPKFKKIEKGPSTYLTKNEENKLVDWLTESQKKGFPRRKEDIQASVKAFLDSNKRKTPFKNNIPGKHWYDAFLKRHPELVHRTPEAVTSASANVSETDIRKWFRDIEDYLKQKEYFDILENPTRVFNGDETCFLFCPKLGKVLAPVGAKNVYEVDQGEAKQNLTVMFTFSAAGDVTPPLIIYPNKRLSANIHNSIPGNWGIGLNDNGWMTSEVFVDYIQNILHPYIVEKEIQLPIILFLDGHKTHLTYEVSMLCSRLQIILIALYPNSTRILQPADVSTFKPLKIGWRKAVLEWRRLNPYTKLGKEHFAPILRIVLDTLNSEVIRKGFEACGLCPWDSNRIDFTKCLGHSKTAIINDVNVEQNSDTKRTMTFEDFSSVVGENKLLELTNNVTSHKCEYSNILKQIHNFFNPQAKATPFVATEAENSIIEIIDASFSEEEIEHMPIIFNNNPPSDETLTPQSLPYNDKIVIHENIKIAEPIFGVASNTISFKENIDFVNITQKDSCYNLLNSIAKATNDAKEIVTEVSDLGNSEEIEIINSEATVQYMVPDYKELKVVNEEGETKGN